MKKLMLFLLISVFLVNLTSASVSNLGTFKQGECINLPQICSDCTYNNISKIIYPNSTIATENKSMQRDDTYYNYTFCVTETFGIYNVNGFGDLGGTKTTWNYIFEITSSGTNASVSQALIYWLSFMGLIIIFSLSMYFAITLPFRNTRGEDGKILSVNKLKYVKLGFVLISYALFNWILNLLLGLSTFLSLTMYEGLFSFLFLLFVRMSWPFFVVWAIIFLITLKNDAKISQLLKRGFKPR